MQQGKSYVVTMLDLSAKVARCRKADLKYYTKTRDYTDIHVLGGEYVSLDLELLSLSNKYLYIYLKTGSFLN